MIVCPLSSGSKGNSTFIESGNQRILIDNGLSAKKLQNRLDAIDVKLNTITALFITHEHSDHIGGAGVLGRMYNIPIYLTEGTYYKKHKNIFNGKETIHFIENDIELGDLTIKAIPVSHDATQPVCYTIQNKKYKVSIATDMGMATQLVKYQISDSDVLLLEMNHNEAMLKKNNNYPWPLKQRIMSNVGHLSNESGAELFQDVVTIRTKRVYLSHLSEENNDPTLAKETLDKFSSQNPLYNSKLIQVADQYSTSNYLEL